MTTIVSTVPKMRRNRSPSAREIPAEQHQYGEADKKVSTGVDRIFESSIFDFSIYSSALLSLVRLSNGSVLPYASFRTLVIADLSISIFTLSATFTSTVVSFTLEIRP